MTAMNPHPELVDDVDVVALAAAVRACPGVDDLVEGAAGAVVSYLPGSRVAGVRVGRERLTVQIRTAWGVPLPAVVAEVRTAVTGLVGGRTVDITIADVADPPGSAADGAGPGPTGPREEAAWTSATSSPTVPPVPPVPSGGPSSAPTTPTGAAIPPPSSPA